MVLYAIYKDQNLFSLRNECERKEYEIHFDKHSMNV